MNDQKHSEAREAALEMPMKHFLIDVLYGGRVPDEAQYRFAGGKLFDAGVKAERDRIEDATDRLRKSSKQILLGLKNMLDAMEKLREVANG